MPSTVHTSQTPLPLPHTEVVELVENDACIGMLAVFGYTLADVDYKRASTMHDQGVVEARHCMAARGRPVLGRKTR